MQVFKNELLSYKNKKLLSSSSIERATIDYRKAWEVGILYSVVDLEKHEKIKAFIKLLEKDIKKVEVLTFLGKDKENYEFRNNYFTENDFSFWGNLDSEIVKKFAEKKFDYLFCIDLDSNIYTENIMARSQASCRVGRFSKSNKDFFELMIKINDGANVQELIEQMYHFIKLLRCPEN
ncbi:hypothetical protein BH23BAC1_BH23BAC1_38230 [soil metagenome]